MASKIKKFKSNTKKYALAIGRLERVKGFDLLIASWANIQTNLVIVGSGKEKRNLVNLINEKLSNKITIIDSVNRDELLSFMMKLQY